jgi:hypothetical protein
MSFYAKLAVFWLIMYSAIWVLARYPSSKLSRFAFSWYGPVPFPGELKSQFMLRWCFYALGWLGQIAFVFACGYVAAWLHPPLTDAMLFLAFWAFALPLLAGMSLLGAIIAGGASLKARLLGPNPAFVAPDHEHPA